MTKNALPKVRELSAHRVNGLNEHLRVFVTDAPGSGGACHDYVILVPMEASDDVCEQHQPTPLEHFLRYNISMKPSGFNEMSGVDLYLGNTAVPKLAKIIRYDTASNDPGSDADVENFVYTRIKFQEGPIKENGINGLSLEALIAVLIDRLEGFQTGTYKCHDNQMALDHLQGARLWTHKRALDRVARQVEGTHMA